MRLLRNKNMKLVKVQIELVIDNDTCEMIEGIYNKDCIVDYLNSKLYTDPEFFGDFGPENIISISEFE
jgi:hypothetical protein